MTISQRVKPESSQQKAEDIDRALQLAALKSLREFRRQRLAARQLPCQPRAA